MQIEPDKLEIIHNPAESRFEIQVDGHLAVLDYTDEGGTLVILHVGVPHEFRGQGVAGVITKAGLEYAKSKSLRVIPLCSYAAAYIRRHPEYAELTK